MCAFTLKNVPNVEEYEKEHTKVEDILITFLSGEVTDIVICCRLESNYEGAGSTEGDTNMEDPDSSTPPAVSQEDLR